MVARTDIQYTIRGVKPSLDRALRSRAESEKSSLNSVIIELLAKELEDPAPQFHHDLDRFIGTWIKDAETDAALIAQRRIESGDWE